MNTDLSELLPTSSPPPMRDRAIRLPEVMRITSLSRATVYRLVKTGEFPAPRRISHKLSAWSENQVHEWLDEKLGLLV